MEKTMSNAGVSGYIDVDVLSSDGASRQWGFHNAIMDYGLEYLANASYRDNSGIFCEIILSDGEDPIKVTDLSPNYIEKYFRSNKISQRITNSSSGGILCDGAPTFGVTIVNTATFHFYNGNNEINNNDVMFDLREISLMVAHNTNVFDGSNGAVFAKSKMKDAENNPFGLEIKNGDIVTITYTIKVLYNLNLNTQQMVVAPSFQNNIYRHIESYENPDFMCQRVKSNDPTESVFNFEVKNTYTTTNFGTSYPKAYINIGLIRFIILIGSDINYEPSTYPSVTSNRYLMRWAALGKFNIRVKYVRYNTLPDLTEAEVRAMSSVTKVDNLTYKYTVPNGARLILGLNGEVNTMHICDTTDGVATYSSNSGTFDTRYTDSPFYDVYIHYKELPLIYCGTIKGIDKVAPYISQGKWESPTQYSFYTEDMSSLAVIIYGGMFGDTGLTVDQLNMEDSTNKQQRDTYGNDISKWKSIALPIKFFKGDENTEYLDPNKSIGKYYLDLPFAIKDYHNLYVAITDAVGNLYNSGKIFTARVDYQPEDFYINYADFRYASDYSHISPVDALRMNIHLNTVKIED